MQKHYCTYFHISFTSILRNINTEFQREAEAHLPVLTAREGFSLPMFDMETSQVWTFRYRFENFFRSHLATTCFFIIVKLSPYNAFILEKESKPSIYLRIVSTSILPRYSLQIICTYKNVAAPFLPFLFLVAHLILWSKNTHQVYHKNEDMWHSKCSYNMTFNCRHDPLS